MASRQVVLTEHLEEFIDSGVESGRYQDADEVIREGLRLLEQRDREDQAKVESLRGAAQDAVSSLERGEGVWFESVDDAADWIHELRRGSRKPDGAEAQRA